jgi:hypothetical protein
MLALSPETIGQKLAKTVLGELVMLYPLTKNAHDDKTFVKVPERIDFSFQEHAKKIVAKEQDTVREVIDDVTYTFVRCFTSCTLSDGGAEIAIDHMNPVVMYSAKIQKLIDYLNNISNKDVRKAFFETKGISEYFIIIGEKIRIKRRLLRACYNSIDNLLAMYSPLNSIKKDQEPHNWLNEQYGAGLQKTLDEHIIEGIIFKKVLPDGVNKASIDQIDIGSICYLHEGTAIGLGAFVRKWCMTRDADRDRQLVKFKVQVLDNFTSMMKTRVAGVTEAEQAIAKKRSDKFITFASPLMQFVIQLYSDDSGTSAVVSSDSGGNSNSDASKIKLEGMKVKLAEFNEHFDLDVSIKTLVRQQVISSKERGNLYRRIMYLNLEICDMKNLLAIIEDAISAGADVAEAMHKFADEHMPLAAKLAAAEAQVLNLTAEKLQMHNEMLEKAAADAKVIREAEAKAAEYQAEAIKLQQIIAAMSAAAAAPAAASIQEVAQKPCNSSGKSKRRPN